MTVLTSETRLLGTGTGLLPRVNLLPPEIAEKRSFRRIQMGLGTAVLASVGVVGLLVVSAGNSVSSAEDDLAAANSTNVTLKAQEAKFQNVTAVYAAAAAAQEQLKTAMGDEVRLSQLLNDLSLAIPGNVWLKNVAFVQTPPTSGALPAGGGAVAAVGAPTPVGTFTVTGIGYSHDDVAVWLESIAGLKTYVNPYFSNSTESLLGTKPIVNFAATATVTDKALSRRYNRAGS